MDIDIKEAWKLARDIARMELKIAERKALSLSEATIGDFRRRLEELRKETSGCQQVSELLPMANVYEKAVMLREAALDSMLLKKLYDELCQLSGEAHLDIQKSPDALVEDLLRNLKGLSKKQRSAILDSLMPLLAHIRGDILLLVATKLPPLPEEPDFMKG
ncbi:MAG: hypothetical protein PHU42_00665 [Patescibacteria group bacterium]|nr:hypothetical protein [Patescibacteria group bacterium]